MSYVTHMNERAVSHIWLVYFVAYDWVVLHVWMSSVTHMNTSCHTYRWVMSHIWTSRITQRNTSCHIYEWVMSHIWRSYVTYMKESCHTHILSCNSPYVIREQVYKKVCWKTSMLAGNKDHVPQDCRVSRMCCLTSEGVITHMKASCHSFEWDMSPVKKSCHA